MTMHVCRTSSVFGWDCTVTGTCGLLVGGEKQHGRTAYAKYPHHQLYSQLPIPTGNRVPHHGERMRCSMDRLTGNIRWTSGIHAGDEEGRVRVRGVRAT